MCGRLRGCRELVGPLNALLQDIETEVRAQALKDMAVYVDTIGADAFAAQVTFEHYRSSS